MKELLVILFLGCNAVVDIKTKRILLWTIPVFLTAALIGWVLDTSMIGGMALLPGVLLLLTGKFTKEAIGYGDGLVVLVLGMFLGMWETCKVVLAAFGLSAVWASVLLLRKRNELQLEIPWIPFLFLSYAGKLVVQWFV